MCICLFWNQTRRFIYRHTSRVYEPIYTVKNMYNLYSINEQQCLVTTKIVQQYKCYTANVYEQFKKKTLI